MKDFVHLHVHSEYSLLDGYAATGAIAKRAAELGMDSIALTDHGVMYGAIEFYTNAKKAGVKPIIGMEAYMAPHARTDPMTKGAKNYYHLLLLAQNDIGYRNLVRLTTRAHLDGMGKGVFARPRIDRELLEQYHEGLVVTSSCIAGEVLNQIKDQQGDQARRTAAYFRDLLGPENYYLELQLHDNTPELEGMNDELVRIGTELGIPLVVTNDTHFVRAEDVEAQKMIMSMGFNLTLKELCSKGFTMDETYHIMSGEQMWERFKRYGTAPLENTRRIADMCKISLDFGRVQLPAFEIPPGHDAASYLRVVCEEGLMGRFAGAPPDHYVKRLDYELDVINQTGFPDYMLIVWDYVTYARSHGIPCLPRGSAGASLVLYTLGITDVDPVANKLLFERFLSPERLEMPDIDVDFADSRRGDVLNYIANKYGRANTAQIITYGTLGAKAALRDIGRVLDVPLNEVDRVAKLIPTVPVGVTIAQALERVPELRQIYDNQPHLKEVIDWAKKVEGRMRSVGTHACGVVVSRSPLDLIVPLQRTTKDDTAVMAAYEGPTLAKVGLLKMDILGLTNLSVVAEALSYIRQTTGQTIALATIPLDDRRTFESLGRGETKNVFQLESTGMTRYLMQLKPTRVDDLYAMVALYRPGPLEQIPVYIHNKNHPQDVAYLHPILKPILEDTYGVIVYQEQIMQLLQAIAGYTLGNAYIVLKAIGKKNKELMASEEPRFKAGCLQSGLTREQADTLWELIQPFAGYSFNRPHSTLYGLLSYQTAYLKVNYPVEYLAAVLSAAAGATEDVAKGVNEARRLKVDVLTPDVNRSSKGFTLEELAHQPGETMRRGIRFGLAAIKNVGEGPVESIIAVREKEGPFLSLEDFCARVDRHATNKRTLESLIKAGALDTLAGSRRQKLAILDQVIGAAADAQKARDVGQASLFDFDMSGGGGPSTSPSVPTVTFPIIKETREDQKEELLWEKELLGTNISADPVTRALQSADLTGVTSLGQLNDESVGQSFTFAGVISGVRRIATKKGDTMLVAVLEDLEGSIELVVFPKALGRSGDLWRDDAVLRVTGKVDLRRDALQMMVDTCEAVKFGSEEPSPAPTAIQPEMEREGVAQEWGNTMMVATAPPTVTATKPAATKPASAPRASAPPPPAATPPAVHSRPRVSFNGNGHSNGNGNGNGNGYSNGNGNGNGHSNGNGNGHSNGNGYAASPPPPTPTGRDLRISLQRSADFDSDIRLMQAIDHVLRSNSGNDRVTLYLRNGVGIVVMRPHYTVSATGAVVSALQEIVGDESVVMG